MLDPDDLPEVWECMNCEKKEATSSTSTSTSSTSTSSSSPSSQSNDIPGAGSGNSDATVDAVATATANPQPAVDSKLVRDTKKWVPEYMSALNWKHNQKEPVEDDKQLPEKYLRRVATNHEMSAAAAHAMMSGILKDVEEDTNPMSGSRKKMIIQSCMKKSGVLAIPKDLIPKYDDIIRG